MRLLHELNCWSDYSFVTLTYDDRTLPLVSDTFYDRPTLYRRDFTLFIKRLRKLIYPRKLKYYACGEYGKNTLRPHYHAILFGVSDVALVEKAWSKGFVKVLPVSVETFRYVAGYIDKGASWSRIRREYASAGLEPPFKAQSTGLGKQYALDNADDLSRRKHLTVNGFKFGLPRYYRKILGLTFEDYSQIIADLNAETFIKYLKKYPFTPPPFGRPLPALDIHSYPPYEKIWKDELRQLGLILEKKFTDAGVNKLR